MDDTASRCIELIAQSKGVSASSISPQSTFESLGVDSLDKINLTFALEEMFSIEIPDESLNRLRTVADMIQGVDELRSGKREPAAS